MRTTFDYYDSKHQLIKKNLVGSVTEIGTEKQMTIFPNIKERMVIFRLRDRVVMRSGYLQYYDKEEKRDRKFSVVKNLRVSKGTSCYGSEYR